MKNMTKKILRQTIVVCMALVISLSTSLAQDGKDPKQLISKVEKAVGNWNDLYAKKNVEFTYKYFYPEQNIMDLSTERYVFEGEKSWAKYSVHQINVLPKSTGEVIQYYDGKTAGISDNGKVMTGAAEVGGAEFLRKANYFWFVMMYKLSDPGTIHKYEGQETVNGVNYDKVSVGYKSDVTGKPQNDAYVLYINPSTSLVDRFFFSLPAMGVNDPVLLMEVEYEDFDGLKLPTKRKAYQPGQTKPFLLSTSSELKFNNTFSEADMKF